MWSRLLALALLLLSAPALAGVKEDVAALAPSGLVLVMDAAGNVMPWVQDGPNKFVWTFSWEDHKGDTSTGTWTGQAGNGDGEGYYAIGIRCASD